jgi:hypothetical protein
MIISVSKVSPFTTVIAHPIYCMYSIQKRCNKSEIFIRAESGAKTSELVLLKAVS